MKNFITKYFIKALQMLDYSFFCDYDIQASNLPIFFTKINVATMHFKRWRNEIYKIPGILIMSCRFLLQSIWQPCKHDIWPLLAPPSAFDGQKLHFCMFVSVRAAGPKKYDRTQDGCFLLLSVDHMGRSQCVTILIVKKQ